MKILALDLGTSTGWAASTPEGRLFESGVQRFELARGESPGCRFLRFRRWLREIVALVQPELLAYERAHHRGGYATELGVGLQTRVQEIAAELGIPYAPVHTATLKKAATGSGRAGKPEMERAACERWGLAPQDILGDDHADALHVLSWALAEYGSARQ